MAYVAVKGGTESIEQSIKYVEYERIKSGKKIDVDKIEAGMRGMIDQVMSESSMYSEILAALAIKQAEGNMEEAVFLLRAHRSTIPRNYYTRTVESHDMQVERRISASFKDIPGGQLLGATYDYSHRLLNFDLLTETNEDIQQIKSAFEQLNDEYNQEELPEQLPKVVDYLREEGLFSHYEKNETEPSDITKQSLQFPTNRSERLQILTRGQTGAVTALGYAAIRGYGSVHPTVGELRVGYLPLTIPGEDENGENDYYIGEIKVTEVESFIPVTVTNNQQEEIEFEIGYGICFGQNETKAIAMSILDQALEHPSKEFPTHDEEFVLLHIDSVEATGFISHLKLPHYVTFQSKLDRLREIKQGEKGNE